MEENNTSRIFRSKRTQNFTVLNNEIFTNTKGRTLKSIGLLCFLLHLPDDWSINKKHLSTLFKDKRFSIDGAIDELVEMGYVEIVQRREAGKFNGVDYYVYDTPNKPDAGNLQTDTPDADFPQSVFPQPVFPQSGNQHLLNTKSKKKEPKKERISVNSNELTGAQDPEVIFVEEERQEEPPLPPAPPIKTYQQLIDVYYVWYKAKNDDVPPKIDGIEGKAVKSLKVYFESVAKSKTKDPLTEEELQIKVVDIFKYILAKWDNLEPFLRKQIKLSQINSNITNIINGLKNGSNTQSTQQQNADRAGTIAAGFASIDKAFS